MPRATKKAVAKSKTSKSPASKPASKAKASKAASTALKDARASQKTRSKAPAAKAAKATKAAKTTKSAGKAAKPAAAKTAAAKKGRTAKAKSPFSAKFLAAQEKALREERLTYLRQSESLRAEAESLVADFEGGDVQFDEESGEGDTLNIERERDLALSAQARQAVEEIDHALAKFADGTYGICEVSGEPIPEARLEAIPWARERVEYKIGGFARRP
jgi:RNA polymerase-binding transcription factor DksA